MGVHPQPRPRCFSLFLRLIDTVAQKAVLDGEGDDGKRSARAPTRRHLSGRRFLHLDVQGQRQLPELSGGDRPASRRFFRRVRYGNRGRWLQHLRGRAHRHRASSTTIYDYLSRQAAACRLRTTGSTSTTSPSPTSRMPSACLPARPRVPQGHGEAGRGPAAAITEAFESEDYEKQRHTIAQQVSEQQEGKLSTSSARRLRSNASPWSHPGPAWPAPKAEDGETMSREQYEALPPEKERQRIDAESRPSMKNCSR